MIQRLVLVGGVVVGGLGSLAGCTGEAIAPGPVENPALYWRLTLNQHAINLSTTAPYDTFRLVATPRTLDGTPMHGLAAPHFSSADPEKVLVSPDGLVRGLQSAARFKIGVTLTVGDLTHTDTALVSVTTNPTPPTLGQLLLEPNPADSAKAAFPVSFISMFYHPNPAIVARAFDTQGNPLATQGTQSSSLVVWIESSDSLTARYDNQARRLATPLGRPGSVTFYASTVAYGVEQADTLAYTIGLPLVGFFQVSRHFTPAGTTPTYRFSPSATVTVATGGHVVWTRAEEPEGGTAYEVTFNNPANVAADTLRFPCGAGDIAPFGDAIDGGTCARRFPVAGEYPFHSAALNTSGTILVIDESQEAMTDLAATRLSVALRPAAFARPHRLHLSHNGPSFPLLSGWP